MYTHSHHCPKYVFVVRNVAVDSRLCMTHLGLPEHRVVLVDCGVGELAASA